MADKYVSHLGSNTSPYDTWAKAATTVATVAGADVAGDKIYVAHDHAESTAAAIAPSWAGSPTSPVLILCGNSAAEPPTTSADTAVITTTGASNITWAGTAMNETRGLTFNAGTGASAANISLGGQGAVQRYVNCKFNLLTTSASSRILASSTAERLHWQNCDVKFSDAGQRISLPTFCKFSWSGGGIASGGTSPASLMAGGGNYLCSEVALENLDLSQASSTLNIFDALTGYSSGTFSIRNSKLPASWSGGLVSGTIAGAGAAYEMTNCDDGATNYRLWRATGYGTVKSETTIVRTGGASDGTTPLSWLMATSSMANFPFGFLETPEIVAWNETTGSSVTATVEIVHDTNVAAGQGAGMAYAFRDDEIWLEVQYLSASGAPLGAFVSDAKAEVLGTGSDQASSSEAWTTTGMTTPVKQKLSVTFTPQMKGFVHARVMLAKASKTCYVDPKLTVA